MRSMTGYGRGVADRKPLQVVVEARAVNHRYLDIRTQFGPALHAYAAAAEARARSSLGRGRVEIAAKVLGTGATGVELNSEWARKAYRDLSRLAEELGVREPVPFAMLGGAPGLWLDAGDGRPDLEDAVADATQEALSQLMAMRETEGAALARDLSARVTRMGQLIASLDPHLTRLVTEARDRLRARLDSLLAGSDARIDGARLEQELAVLADRGDVTEELTRLRSHCDQFETLLASDGAIGRKLDFLLQEMSREVNTTGSKVADVGVTRVVLDMKSELERMREQAQNVL